MIDWDQIESEVRAELAGLTDVDLDVAQMREFSQRIANGDLGPASNRFSSEPVPAGPGDVDDLERIDGARLSSYRERGEAALASGELAVAVLNGGMATRFGGVVKGVVEAVGNQSFIEIKYRQARRAGPLPFLMMNSFATHSATERFLAERDFGVVETFLQGVSVRLDPGGVPLRDAHGKLSLYAPGHGDFPSSIRAGERLAELRARGVRTVMLSNVDNLGAEPDPVILGYHLEHGRPLTCEVARAIPGDAGGTPALVDGRAIVVEGFRFSSDFDFASLHYLSTNTFLFALEALEQEFPLSWFYVEKNVGGAPAIQMERLVNELSSFVDTGFLATPRFGVTGRFFPVKDPTDLDALRADFELVRRFGAV